MHFLVKKNKILYLFLFLAILFFLYPAVAVNAAYPVPDMDPQGYPALNTGCLAPGKCHAGIEPIRAHQSEMAKQIYDMGAKLGDPNGCVVCHGGDPKEEKDAKKPTLVHLMGALSIPLSSIRLPSGSMRRFAANATKIGSMPSTAPSCRPKRAKSKELFGDGVLQAQVTR